MNQNKKIAEQLDEFDRDDAVTFFQLAKNKEKYGALKYSKWNDDIQVMMAAVQQNWRALEFASDRLKNNRYFVQHVVARNGEALQFTPLKNDEEFVLRAMEQETTTY